MTSKLSPQQLQQFKQAFKMLDTDGDGKITPIELCKIMKQFGHNPSEVEIEIIFKNIDTDKSGTIELQQFLLFIATKANEQKDEKDDLRSVFRMFDIDGDGYITKKELMQGLNNLGEHMTEKEVSDLVQAADLDGDGNINFQQFVELMKFK